MLLRRFSGVGFAVGGLLAVLGTALLLAQPGHAAGTEQGPVAEYSFDEGEEGGETVTDLAGEDDGTIEGVKRVRGRYGEALEFDGEEGCVQIPDGPQFQMGEEFTLEAWVRPESAHEFAPIFYKQGSEGGYGYDLWASEVEGGAPAGEVNDGTYPQPQIEGKAELRPNVWSHVAFTFDGAHMRLYVDGELVASGASGAPIESEGPLKIGCAEDYGYEHHFEGRIDEPRIYERALSGPEVGADMETPIQTPKQGPVAEYSFDEGEAGVTTVEDTSGDGHTATIEDGEWTKGRYGGGIGFDGLGGNKCVSVPDSPELRFSEEFTLEAWIRPEGGSYEDPVVVRESSGKTAFGLGLGSREEYEAEGFIGEGSGSKAAVGGEKIREYEWVHLAATWDGSTIRLYVDGELADTETATSPPATGEGSLKIGCDGPDGQFTGQIDEVRAYDRTLTGAEVGADTETPLQTPDATPVARYSFDEDNEETEETAEDLTGDGHTATVEGAKWTEHGRYGGAYEFDAEEEDVLKIPASPELNFGEEFTLEAWVRPSGSDNHHAPLIDKQEGAGLGYFLYEGGTVSDRPVGAVDEEQEHVHADEPLPAHAWSHVALIFNGNRTFLYVDGELVDNGAAEPVVTSEGELEIGGSSDTGEYFDGRIDEVRIYGRGLSQAEVQADASAPVQTPQHGPIAAYSLEEGSGEIAEDITGHKHTATIEGAEWTRGKFGDALRFDGEDQVTIPAAEDLNLTEAFTLEAWIKPENEDEYGHLFVKEDAAEEQAAYVITKHGSKLAAHLGIPGVIEESPSEALEIGSWQYVAATFDGERVRLYVNGELVGDASVAEVLSTNGALRIGGTHLWGSGKGFKGRIDQVRIYNRALGRAEIGNGLDRTPPEDLSASGELAELGYPYISGQGTKTVEVSATDDLSGIRTLALEDEGHRLLASYTPTTCVFNSPGADHCPLSVAKELTVNAVRMPEGANHLSVFAEDLAGNISHGSFWVEYVDRIGPSFPSSFEVAVSNELPWADPTVHLPSATDPLLPEGHVGAGVVGEFYRYKLNGGPFTEWLSNEFGGFEVPGAVAGDSISLEAYATDGVGNGGATRTATVTVPAAEEEIEEEVETVAE
jgi:hypothetical protein